MTKYGAAVLQIFILKGMLVVTTLAVAGVAPEELARRGNGGAGQDATLPFTVSITPVTPTNLPAYLNLVADRTQDYPFSTAVIDGEFWVMMKNGYSETVFRYKGTNIETAVRQPDGRLNRTNPTWGTVVNPYVLGGMWYDSTEKKLYAPMHCEYNSVYGGGNERLNRQVHLATSTDKGLTWNYEGPIITRDAPKNPRQEPEYSGSLWDGGEGDFYLYADESHGYVYVYTSHNLWPKPGNSGPRFWAHHVARCAISDKLAPGKWRKFYNGGWSEPALGGKASYVEAYNVIYGSYLGKYVSLNYGGGLSVCSDLAKQDWTPSFRIPGGNWGYNDIWAWTLTNTDKKDVKACDATVYVYSYWMAKPCSVYKIDFGRGETQDTSGYGGAGVAAPVFAHTMIPIRPYGEPLYDNADPIESRRVRKVNCDSPEMSYSGGWTSQASPVKAKAGGTTNSSVAFVFKGSGIYWRAATGPDCGKADVYLDEIFQKTVDLYGDFTPYQFGFIKTGLDAGKVAHTIKIVVKGEKNPQSSGTAVKHMSFEYSAESYQASDGFCSVMGKNQWHYQWRSGSVYDNLEYRFRNNLWTKDGGTVAVGPNCQTPDDANDAVRKWVAPHSGTVRIEGLVSLNAGGGDGVKVKILRNTTEVWGPRPVTYGNPASHDFNLDVAEGDSVYFCVNKNTTCVNDSAAWDPVITFVLNKASLSVGTPRFTMEEHGANPVPQNIAIAYTGPNTGRAFHAETDSAWLSVSTVSGAGNGQVVRCAVNAREMDSGIYAARVAVTHNDIPDGDIPDTLSCEVVARVNGAPRPVSLSMSPATTTTIVSATKQFTARTVDQFGDPHNGKAVWNVSGGGTIDGTGLFKSDGTRGLFTVTCCLADQAALTATARVEVVTELLARWKLDETSGTVAADSSGAGIAGKLLGSKGGPTWTNAAGRAGLYFNGIDNVVDTGTRLKDLSLPFSIAFWVNPAATQVEYADILGNHDGSLGLVVQQDGKKTNLFGFGYGDGKQGYGPGLVQLTAGEWQHVAVVCDGERAVCHVNGAENCSNLATGAFAHNPNLNFRLGQGYKEGRFFHGLLSDVRIYRKALSAAEVRALAKEGGVKSGNTNETQQ